MTMLSSGMALALAVTLAQAQPPARPREAPTTDETVPVQRGTRLTINNFAGEVVIHTWDKDQVHVVARHQARTQVNISSDTVGRVTQLSVQEGDRVKKGQFLMQIDPRIQQTATERNEASLAEARASLEQQRTAIVSARENLSLARENLRRQRELWAQQLTTRQELDNAENVVKVREAELREREQAISTQEQRIRQSQANLSGARMSSCLPRSESRRRSSLVVHRARTPHSSRERLSTNLRRACGTRPT